MNIDELDTGYFEPGSDADAIFTEASEKLHAMLKGEIKETINWYEQAKKEITPQPVIGKRSYQKYLKENLVRPTDDNCKDIKGEVVLSFFVDEEGKPQNITVIHGLCEFADKEAIRLVKEGPKWTSGKLPARVTVRF